MLEKQGEARSILNYITEKVKGTFIKRRTKNIIVTNTQESTFYEGMKNHFNLL